ncbi:E3 ubiquitin-protein ligase RNF19A [Patella vulgata]|uniref:E3 ubiquitin-protein ligase RNF19A n=1 Tax=Patella vulgata TaxID=6465 RepID=UPI00218075FF|nr:E3 ubiquitin-protein ligase RNF19A [Patella vulgata]
MKKDSEVVSTSSGQSRNSDYKKGSSFSLRRIFSGQKKRSKSHSSLDSDSARSETSLNVSNESSAGLSQASGFQSTCYAQKRKDNMIECPVCLTDQPTENFQVVMTCHHRTCRDCLRQYLQIEITESRVNIACPECSEKFHPNDIRLILQDEGLMVKYEDFMLRRILAMDPDTRWCPAPDCGYAVIAAGCAGCPKLKCERIGCDTFFCYHCKQYWHPNKTCDAARAERSPNLRSGSIYSHENGSQNDIKPCPRCSAFIVKMNDGSCNHMTCAVCGAEFCWLCMKEISDLHYLSPSGCTFWGKKPWSRKKKILWQLGTLVGAPVGISLVAGIAVPAMIIGIPVWVGRKIHSRYVLDSKHKRRLAVTGGVTASILVSPIIAGLAVGIGVPILLAYVYGVVPISLCRSGGCGVTTSQKGGVRFEFDENDGNAASTYGAYGGDNQSVETAPHVANPSIAPSIGEASVGMTGSLSASGSHLDRVGMLRDESDRDSSSNRAIAGASLNGSLCGSAYAAVIGYQNKLEVQADVSSNMSSHKRASFSSESANISLSEKSATVSFSDDVSTRALAGSISAYRDKDGVSLSSPPFEVQADVEPNRSIHSKSSYERSPSLRRSVSNSIEELKEHSHKSKKCTRFIDDDDKAIGIVRVYSKKHEPSTSNHREIPSARAVTLLESKTRSVSHSSGESITSETSKFFVLPEVETDRPTRSLSTNNMTESSVLLKRNRQVSYSCSGVYEHVTDNSRSSERKSPRRHSCEMAFKHGRISPSEMK